MIPLKTKTQNSKKKKKSMKLPFLWDHSVSWTFCSRKNQFYPSVSVPAGPKEHSLMAPGGHKKNISCIFLKQGGTAQLQPKYNNYIYFCTTWAIMAVTTDKGSSSSSCGSHVSFLTTCLVSFEHLGLYSSSWKQWKLMINYVIHNVPVLSL